MTNDLKRDIMQVGEQMGLQEIQFEGTAAIAGEHGELILAMALVGIEPEEVTMGKIGYKHVIY